MGWLTSVLNFFTNPIAEVVGGWNERKTIAAKNAGRIAEAEVEAKIAKFEADAERYKLQATADQDYDMQVLRNRQGSPADELIIVIWFVVFLMHFFPFSQPYMATGWKAMGYPNGPAWWFEFGMVGILVSTLGLMRVLRLMLGKSLEKRRSRAEGKADAADTSRVLSSDS